MTLVSTCPNVTAMTSPEPLGPMVRIRDLRAIRGWTMQQLADRIAEHGVSVTESGISNIETGGKQASERLLIAWAKALGIDPMNLWHGPLRKPVEPGVPAKASA